MTGSDAATGSPNAERRRSLTASRTMLLSSCSVAWADACNSPDKGRGPTERSLDRTRRRPHRERDCRPPSCPHRSQWRIGSPSRQDRRTRCRFGCCQGTHAWRRRRGQDPRTAFAVQARRRCRFCRHRPLRSSNDCPAQRPLAPLQRKPFRHRSPLCLSNAGGRRRARGRYRPRKSTPEQKTSHRSH